MPCAVNRSPGQSGRWRRDRGSLAICSLIGEPGVDRLAVLARFRESAETMASTASERARGATSDAARTGPIGLRSLKLVVGRRESDEATVKGDPFAHSGCSTSSRFEPFQVAPGSEVITGSAGCMVSNPNICCVFSVDPGSVREPSCGTGIDTALRPPHAGRTTHCPGHQPGSRENSCRVGGQRRQVGLTQLILRGRRRSCAGFPQIPGEPVFLFNHTWPGCQGL